MIYFNLTQITAPAAEPVTTAEAKSHMKVDVSDDDTLIAGLVKAARIQIEKMTRLALMPQTWDMVLDHFPNGAAPILFPKPPLVNVSSVTYIDAAGAEQTLTTHQVDTLSTPGRITPAVEATWPETQAGKLNAVTIRFKAGHETAASPTDDTDADDVPETAKTAIKMLAGHWYEHRETVVLGPGATPVPMAVEWLADALKVTRFY